MADLSSIKCYHNIVFSSDQLSWDEYLTMYRRTIMGQDVIDRATEYFDQKIKELSMARDDVSQIQVNGKTRDEVKVELGAMLSQHGLVNPNTAKQSERLAAII